MSGPTMLTLTIMLIYIYIVAGQRCNDCVVLCYDQAPKFTATATVRTNAALILRENKLIRDKQEKEAAVIKVTYWVGI